MAYIKKNLRTGRKPAIAKMLENNVWLTVAELAAALPKVRRENIEIQLAGNPLADYRHRATGEIEWTLQTLNSKNKHQTALAND